MSNAVVVKPQATALSESSHWTPEQFQLIKNTIARGATNDELQLFLYRCRMLQLDPLKPGQIYFIKYGTNPGAIVIGIDGFRSKAARTGKLRGVKREVIRLEGKVIGAWAEVSREGWSHPAREEVALSEYTTGKNNWADMPETMIKKVAEAAALRMAFPDELGGVYADVEMERQSEKPPAIYPEQPTEIDGFQTNSYTIPYGPLAKQAIEKADPAKLRDYVLEIEDKARRLNKPIPKWAEQLIKEAEPLIAEFENGNPDKEPGWGDGE